MALAAFLLPGTYRVRLTLEDVAQGVRADGQRSRSSSRHRQKPPRAGRGTWPDAGAPGRRRGTDLPRCPGRRRGPRARRPLHRPARAHPAAPSPNTDHGAASRLPLGIARAFPVGGPDGTAERPRARRSPGARRSPSSNSLYLTPFASSLRSRQPPRCRTGPRVEIGRWMHELDRCPSDPPVMRLPGPAEMLGSGRIVHPTQARAAFVRQMHGFDERGHAGPLHARRAPASPRRLPG